MSSEQPRRLVAPWDTRPVGYGGEYNADVGDPHFRADQPLAPTRCGCEVPLPLANELGELRCVKCGRLPPDAIRPTR